MRKNVFGRQLKRDANERKALFKNLLTSLVLHERIETTHAKAKAIKAAADKLVTKAKIGGERAKFLLGPDVNYDAVAKLVTDIAPRFATREGGYTRIIRTRRRVADNAPMVLMEWVEKPLPAENLPKTEKKVKKAKVAKPAKETKVEATAKVAEEKPKKTVAPKKATEKEKK